MDKRVKRTKVAIFNAAMELLLEKSPDSISVIELCNKAQINKSTFYFHYKNINDCLQACCNTIMAGVNEFAEKVDYFQLKRNPEPFLKYYILQAEKNLDYLCRFKNCEAAGASLTSFKQSVVDAIAKNNNFDMQKNYHELLSLTFVISGCVDTLIQMLPSFDKNELMRVMCNMIRNM